MSTATQILEAFLAGRGTLTDTVAGLEGAVELTAGPTSRTVIVRPLEARVRVNTSSLVPVLQAFLNHRLSAQAVSEWASFVLAVSAYELPEESLASQAPEPVREALWGLSKPPASLSVTEASVRAHLGMLSGYAG
jgi:hypothetical protein